MLEITLTFTIASFVAGVLMFFAPCTFPLVPAFLAFISGIDQNKKSGHKTRVLVKNAMAFCLGFSVVFIGFGILAGLAGSLLGSLEGWLLKIGGLIVIFFGLVMMNVIKLNSLFSGKTFALPKVFIPGNPVSSALVGASFAFGWTPCIGPILASILLLVSTEGELLTGAFLLAVFSLGLSLPFILTAFFYDKVKSRFNGWSSFNVIITRVGGFLTVIFGLLLFFGNFGILVEWGTEVFMLLGLDFIFDHL